MAKAGRKKNNLNLNKDFFVKVRNSPEVRRELRRMANESQSRLGPEYKVTDLLLEGNRAAVSILATGKAVHQNNKNHTLLKELLRHGTG